MRKFFTMLICFLLLLSSTSVSFAQDLAVKINRNSVNSGALSISCLYDKNVRVKLLIQKGDTRYTYNLKTDGTYEGFPLQSGDGEYEISVLRNIEGNNYIMAFQDNITLKMQDQNSVYTNSIQMIKWNDSMEAVKKAHELTDRLNNDKDKVDAIYNFVKYNMKYDYKKLEQLSNDYLPDADKIFADKKGICYDYSSLLAVMLRSIGIPAKLDMGYTKNINGYHAWNEVFVKELNKWIVIDTTYDSILQASNIKTDMIKETEKYQKLKEY